MPVTTVAFDPIRHMDRAIAPRVCEWCGQGRTRRRVVLPNGGWAAVHVGGCARAYWDAYATTERAEADELAAIVRARMEARLEGRGVTR